MSISEIPQISFKQQQDGGRQTNRIPGCVTHLSRRLRFTREPRSGMRLRDRVRAAPGRFLPGPVGSCAVVQLPQRYTSKLKSMGTAAGSATLGDSGLYSVGGLWLFRTVFCSSTICSLQSIRECLTQLVNKLLTPRDTRPGVPLRVPAARPRVSPTPPPRDGQRALAPTWI